MEKFPSNSVESLAARGSSRVHVGNSYNTTNHYHDESDQGRTKKYLEKLRSTDPREDKARIEQTNGGLLKDSYVWILENPEFLSWRDNQDCRLLWIRGDPGKGKTMLLSGIINELQPSTKLESPENPILLSYFFCQATNSGLNNYTSIIQGLIYLLVTQQPTLLLHLQDTHGYNMSHWNSRVTLEDVFRKILADPVTQEIYLVIDALDECIENLPLLLALISTTRSHAKWIVSSRNRGEIGERLEQLSSKLAVSLELHEESVSKAIDSYIIHRVRQLSDSKNLKAEVARQVHDYLSEHAHGTFLWVALVCQQLERCRAWEMSKNLQRFPQGLNQFYARMINQIVDSDSYELYIRLLAVASTVFRPITFSELLAMEDLQLDEEMLPDVIAECGSFLTTKENTIILIHQSAKDFLITESSMLLFQHGLAQHHYNIFKRCITVLQSLHKDMYYLVYPGVSLGEAFQNRPKPDPLDELKYSCVFWFNHLQESYQLHTQDGKESEFYGIENAYNFISEKFLFWVEALSLCQNLSVTAKALLFLKGLPAPGNPLPDQIALLEDALRFFSFFSPVIKDYPLQTYASGLFFSPKESAVRQLFEKYTPNIFAKVPKIDDNWSPILGFFDYHEEAGDIISMKFSSTSHTLVAATRSLETIIWQVSEDPVPEITKRENTAWPTLSPDGKWLAAITMQHSDETQEPALQVRDLRLNRIIWTRDVGNRNVRSMEISPDSKWLVVSYEKELELFDIKAGIHRTWPFELYYEGDYLMFFSSDCALVALIPRSEPFPIQVLDLRMGTQYNNYYCPVGITIGAFVPNTHSLMCCSDENIVYVWHVVEQTCEEWISFPYGVHCLAFSHSESWVVIGNGFRLFLYDHAQRTLLRELDMPTGWSLNKVAVSFDDQKIAVCTAQEIWIIDAPAFIAGNPQSGKKNWENFHISSDGRLIAYELCMRIEVWDSTTSDILTSLATGDIVHGEVKIKTFSPNGRHLAFSDHSSIFAWDIVNNHLQKLSVHPAFGPLLAISDGDGNDGCWLAAVESLGSSSVVSVWDIMTGQRKRYVRPSDDTQQRAAAITFTDSRLGILWRLPKNANKAHVAKFILYSVETGEQLFRVDIPASHGPVLWHGSLRLSSSGRLAIFRSHGHDRSIIWDWRGDIRSAQVANNETHPTNVYFLNDSTVSTGGGLLHIESSLNKFREPNKRNRDRRQIGSEGSQEQFVSRLVPGKYGYRIDGEWLKLDNKPLLWIPALYRHCFASIGYNHVVVISVSSTIYSIYLNEDIKEIFRASYI
ncbi:Vegetative incompatibility protein HET-E-1-like protein 15 [Fusarium oxysporum f. sp. phaseoli]